MPCISLQTAITLTDLSERTIRRRLADGVFKKASAEDSSKILLDFDLLQPDWCLPFESEHVELIVHADRGDVKAQNDLALFFLEHDQTKSALYWLELAIKQGFVDAMYLMGCCYLNGTGVKQDNNLAVMWIAKAAALGHTIAVAQIEAIYPKLAEQNQFMSNKT